MKEMKTIPGFSRYLISKSGDVWTKIYKKIMKQKIDRYGYPVISLINDQGIKKYPPIHRLVALTYIPNPYDLGQINHIDGNKRNNNVSNLEWITVSKNIEHSFRTDLNRNHFYVNVYDLKTKETKQWASLKSLGKFLNILAPVLIGLIRFSKYNPILNRYIIKFQNFEEYIRYNTKNFGKKIFVYDYITKSITKYESFNAAKYYLGLRTHIGSVDSNQYLKIGYYLSYGTIYIPPKNNFNIKEMLVERTKYVLTEYKPNAKSYLVYDYFNKVQYELNTLKEVVLLVNSRWKPITNSYLASLISYNVHNIKNVIINGYGISPYKENIHWFNYTVEEVYHSCFRINSRAKIYECFLPDGSSEILKSIYDVIMKFDLNLKNRHIPAIKDLELIESYKEKTGCLIKRLNYPILN